MAGILECKIEDYEELNLNSAIWLENVTSKIILRDIKVEDFSIFNWTEIRKFY